MTLKPNRTEPTRRWVRWVHDDVWALARIGSLTKNITLGAWLTEAIKEKIKRESRNKS